MNTVITDNKARTNLATNVNHILKSRGWTQRDLAEAAERPLMSINNVCCNRSLPGVTLVLALGEALGYSVEQLTGSPSVIAVEERRRKKVPISA